MKRFNVIVGDDFEIEAFGLTNVSDVKELSRVNDVVTRAKLRDKFSHWILFFIVFAMFVATVIGVRDGSLNEVGSVWSAAALPLGIILKSYFEKPAPT